MTSSKYFCDRADGSIHDIFDGVRISTHCGEKMMLSLVETPRQSSARLPSAHILTILGSKRATVSTRSD